MRAFGRTGRLVREVDHGQSEQRESVRIILSSTRFIASLFWLTIIVAFMVFVLPYSDRTDPPVLYGFVFLGLAVFLAHRYFPYEGYHPVLFFLLLLGTDAMVAVMVYLTGGSDSTIPLLFLLVIIFSSAYFELLETMLITAVTCAAYFAPVIYESVSLEALKSMAIAVPIYFIIALCGYFVISKAREQEREKQAMTHLYDQADTKRRELSTLYAASLKLASTLDREEMISILLDNAAELVADRPMLLALFDSQRVLKVEDARGFAGGGTERLLEDPKGNPIYVSASAVLPVIIADAAEDERFRPFLERMGFASMIAVPLYASASVIGVLACFSQLKGAYDDDAARVLLTLSSEAALALEKASLYQTTLQDKTKIEAIINSLTDGLMVIDRDANLVLANPFVARLIDLRPDGYDTPLGDLIERSRYGMEFQEASYAEALSMVLEGGESYKHEMVLLSDPPTIFQVYWVPLKEEGGRVSGAVILLHDITDFVELDRMKSEFISIVSHELKTPLTSIKGFVRLLSAERVGPVTAKQRHYLDIVQRQTESLTMLINDLLDLSKIEAGIIEVQSAPVSLASVTGEVVQHLEGMAGEKGIGLHVEIPADLPPVCGDSDRLGQVFMNLIHNAIKFTPKGGSVRVKAGLIGEECLVRVSDNGIGISQQDLPRIFDKFYQVDSSTTRQQSGTGLGLPITRQLVTAHGGELWVNSALDKGTTFSFTLPLHRAQSVPRAV